MRTSEQFGSGSSSRIRTYSYSLTAGVSQRLSLSASFFSVKSATNSVLVSFDGDTPISMDAGETIYLDYGYVDVSSASTQTVELIAGKGEYNSNRVESSVTVNATVEPGNSLVALGAVTIGAGLTGLIAAADAAQKDLIVSVPLTAANGIFVGPSSVGALTPGVFVERGSSLVISTEAAVYGYNSGAASVTVNSLRNRRV